jgi:hypothetical protein
VENGQSALLGTFEEILAMSVGHGAKVCLAGLLGAKIGYRALCKKKVNKVMLFKPKEDNKFVVRQLLQQNLLERLLEK